VAVNRAVAVAEVEGPDAALTLLDSLDLENYYLFHTVRAEMLRRLGCNDEAATAYEAAIARTNNLTEREYMQRRLDGLAST
jgi:RNA polymerase sigma-70 factor (ECF subfamily)